MLIDLIAAIVISLGFYLGYQRGLIKTLFDTLSIFVGIIVTLKFSDILINVLEKSTNINPSIIFFIGIIATFIIVMIIIRFIGKKLEDVFKAVNLNFINKFNGGALQGLFFAIVFSLLLGLGDKVQLIKEKTKSASISYPYLAKMPAMSEKIFTKLRPMFQDFWDKTMETMDKIKEKSTNGNESSVE